MPGDAGHAMMQVGPQLMGPREALLLPLLLVSLLASAAASEKDLRRPDPEDWVQGEADPFAPSGKQGPLSIDYPGKAARGLREEGPLLRGSVGRFGYGAEFRDRKGKGPNNGRGGDWAMDSEAESASGTGCANTVQGRELLADDSGFVCSRREVEVLTGCCPKAGERFSCLGCNQTLQCCTVYEHCVACCQHPLRTPAVLATSTPWADQPSSTNYPSLFEYCRGRCRHNSKSVVHENSYRSESHHCYRLPPPPVPALSPEDEDSLAGLTIVKGGPGVSCDEACASGGDPFGRLKCVERKLRALNNCSTLQKYFSCTVCTASTGDDQPAEVLSTAPVDIQPGACLYNTRPELFSCTGSHPETRRLCPCIEEETPGLEISLIN